MARIVSPFAIGSWVVALSTLLSCLASGGAEAYAADATNASAVAAANAAPQSAVAKSNGPNWKMTPVTSVQVRVQGNLPAWDADKKIFSGSFGNSFEEKYRSVLDTVNMAAVEGAFKYVQAECINKSVITDCKRKNNIKYVVFYKTTIVQPRAAVAYYQNDKTGKAAIEHCPFIPMDGGQCTPTNGVLPKECDQYLGANGQPKLGFCIGGQLQDQELLAPYPNNYWFSYPNSCPTQTWGGGKKTDECRAEQAGGVCPFGVEPDGIKCSFKFEILGWVLLDDVVGITSMVNPATNATYVDYADFCKAGGVEFDATVADGKVTVNQSLPFWKDPTNPTANAQRAQTLVDMYQKVMSANSSTSDGGVMRKLPSIASLTAANPPCYVNNVQCAKAKFGCRRKLYSQICEVCTTRKGEGCVVRPPGYKFPQL
jgi:hypothetical protein|uniref:Uncharacterized protein n=1 Tax=Globisporangium ultimum (strain ATCC 200006 / CBS 805.95 / DAOM BR144) TaxID=431595 RepID=K3W936_GLOUD